MDLKTVSDLSNYFNKEGIIKHDTKIYKSRDPQGFGQYYKEVFISWENPGEGKVKVSNRSIYEERKKLERPIALRLEDIFSEVETDNREVCIRDNDVTIDLINKISILVSKKVETSIKDLREKTKEFYGNITLTENETVIKVNIMTPSLESKCKFEGLSVVTNYDY